MNKEITKMVYDIAKGYIMKMPLGRFLLNSENKASLVISLLNNEYDALMTVLQPYGDDPTIKKITDLIPVPINVIATRSDCLDLCDGEVLESIPDHGARKMYIHKLLRDTLYYDRTLLDEKYFFIKNRGWKKAYPILPPDDRKKFMNSIMNYMVLIKEIGIFTIYEIIETCSNML